MRYEPQGLDRYAKFDQSDTRIRQAQHVHVPSWRGAWIWCLRHQDYDAAELIVSRNLVSDECLYQDHDLCNYAWCLCPHHSAVQFRAEHPGIKGLWEIESEERELTEVV